MGYQALYRVWRPNRFDDLIGQHHVTTTLQNAMIHEKLSHAYLFTGPRGTGKTTVARLIAKTMNCEKAPTPEPCNECVNCLSIMDGSNPDVIEIDAASHRGIDNIRDLRDKVKYAPSQAKIKVYIIDEVHMLSTEAFNALLKTLEEPPRHVMFILATTEPHKLPGTIISRCQRFDFKQISNQAMVERMKMITEQEGVKADDYALALVARAAEGGMRDALSILDQVIAFSENEITIDDVLAVTDTVSDTFLSQTVTAFLNQHVEEALRIVNEVIDNGKDPMRFIEDLIFYLRDLLLYQTAPSLVDVQERASRDDAFRKLAEQATKPWLYSVIEMLNDSQQNMKWTTNKRVFLEVAFVKICHHQQVNNELLEELQKKVNALESEVMRLKNEGIPTSEKSSKALSQERLIQRPSRVRKQTFVEVENMLKSASKQALSKLQSVWGTVMETIRKEKISAHAWLKDSRPVACSDDTFLLAFPYEMHSQMASKEQIRTTVEQAVHHIYKQPLRMLTIVDSDWEIVKQKFIQSQQQEEGHKEQEEKQDDPLIAEAKRLFGEEIIEFK